MGDGGEIAYLWGESSLRPCREASTVLSAGAGPSGRVGERYRGDESAVFAKWLGVRGDEGERGDSRAGAGRGLEARADVDGTPSSDAGAAAVGRSKQARAARARVDVAPSGAPATDGGGAGRARGARAARARSMAVGAGGAREADVASLGSEEEGAEEKWLGGWPR